MNPYNVVHGPLMVRGQIALGHVLGVRLIDEDLDVMVFAPTRDNAMSAAQILGLGSNNCQPYGSDKLHMQCALVREHQLEALSAPIGMALSPALMQSAAAEIAARAAQLVKEAERHGLVLTIEEQSLQPPRMGNTMVNVGVRPARGNY